MIGIHRYFFGLLTWFAEQGPNSQTKGSRLRSPFFKLQEKYISLELANLILTQEMKKLSSGKISVRGVLIQVRYLRLSFFLVDHGHHTVPLTQSRLENLSPLLERGHLQNWLYKVINIRNHVPLIFYPGRRLVRALWLCGGLRQAILVLCFLASCRRTKNDVLKRWKVRIKDPCLPCYGKHRVKMFCASLHFK